jgi:hypothetical protein
MLRGLFFSNPAANFFLSLKKNNNPATHLQAGRRQGHFKIEGNLGLGVIIFLNYYFGKQTSFVAF